MKKFYVMAQITIEKTVEAEIEAEDEDDARIVFIEEHHNYIDGRDANVDERIRILSVEKM